MLPEYNTDPRLLEALRKAALRRMTEHEINEQRDSWVRGNEPTGDPRFD